MEVLGLAAVLIMEFDTSLSMVQRKIRQRMSSASLLQR